MRGNVSFFFVGHRVRNENFHVLPYTKRVIDICEMIDMKRRLETPVDHHIRKYHATGNNIFKARYHIYFYATRLRNIFQARESNYYLPRSLNSFSRSPNDTGHAPRSSALYRKDTCI